MFRDAFRNAFRDVFRVTEHSRLVNRQVFRDAFRDVFRNAFRVAFRYQEHPHTGESHHQHKFLRHFGSYWRFLHRTMVLNDILYAYGEHLQTVLSEYILGQQEYGGCCRESWQNCYL